MYINMLWVGRDVFTNIFLFIRNQPFHAGLFDDEIVPVKTILVDKDGNEKPVTIKADDGVRAGTTMEILGKLKPVFKEGGSVATVVDLRINW